MDDDTLYEIAIENRTNIKHLIKQYEDTNGLIKELLNEHKNCPGKIHALQAEGSGRFLGTAAMVVGMLTSLFASIWAIFQSKHG